MLYLQHYDFTTDKVGNSLRIQVLVDTCAMRPLALPRDTGHHFVSWRRNAESPDKLSGLVDHKPVLIARAELNIRNGASTNCWL